MLRATQSPDEVVRSSVEEVVQGHRAAPPLLVGLRIRSQVCVMPHEHIDCVRGEYTLAAALAQQAAHSAAGTHVVAARLRAFATLLSTVTRSVRRRTGSRTRWTADRSRACACSTRRCRRCPRPTRAAARTAASASSRFANKSTRCADIPFVLFALPPSSPRLVALRSTRRAQSAERPSICTISACTRPAGRWRFCRSWPSPRANYESRGTSSMRAVFARWRHGWRP